MPQTITRGHKAMVEEAERKIETVSAEEAKRRVEGGGVTLVDIRDPRELERDGHVPGAFHCTRGMLEFWIDPESKYYKPAFGEDKQFIFFCAGGMRSALAGATAHDMGLRPVAHMEGGYRAWKEAGGKTEPWVPKPQKG